MAMTIMMAIAAAATMPQAAIEAEMAASAAAWNRGDMDGFLAVYAPDAIFVTDGGVVRGRAAIAARYAKSYTGLGKDQGALTFQPVAFRTLSPVHLLWVARWSLAGSGTVKAASGYTTLLFERRKEGWRIISDHSS